MDDRKCRWCNNRDPHTGTCSILQEEFKLDSNIETLFDDGSVGDVIKSAIEQYIDKNLNGILSTSKKISLDERDEMISDMALSIEEDLQIFFRNNLNANIEIDPLSDFYCCKYR